MKVRTRDLVFELVDGSTVRVPCDGSPTAHTEEVVIVGTRLRSRPDAELRAEAAPEELLRLVGRKGPQDG